MIERDEADAAGFVVTWQISRGGGRRICAWGDTVSGALQDLAASLVGVADDGRGYEFTVVPAKAELMDMLREYGGNIPWDESSLAERAAP